ncbi:QRFP-like peptide receptor isoform X2 [Schistocerca gregaria]|uniref:QRFP-like peptide receptor isoform X2 n=2 Tax=Schistocerca TaxID=7008 RepID=UPI00211F1A21|nr:QRFP-like peptide receptor isoform X2 [Schistocerca gregaria]
MPPRRNETAVRGLGAEGEMRDDYYEDYYDYDYEEAVLRYNWVELLPALVVYTLTLLIGLAGNSLIIFTVCRYRKLKNATNVFLASLASADLLLVTVCVPVKLAKLFSHSWTMGAFICKLLHYLQSVSAICSVLTLTAMSIERYYAIVHPMRAKYTCTIRQARRVILIIWTASLLLAVPIIFVQGHKEVGTHVRAYWCIRDWEIPLWWRLHEVYMLLLILVIPTCIMTATYSAVCWEVWRVTKTRHGMTAGSLKSSGSCRHSESFILRSSKKGGTVHTCLKKTPSSRSEDDTAAVKQLIKMLVAIVILFVISWGPSLIDNVLTAYGVIPWQKHGMVYKDMSTAFLLMAYCNSCINPVVYGFMSKNFRESFKKALCRWHNYGALTLQGSSYKNKRHMSLSQTRTTSVRFGRSTSVSANQR